MAVVILLLGLLAAACSTKQTPKKVQGADSAKPMNTPDEAEAAFDAAEKELGDMLLTKGRVEEPSQPKPVPPAPADGLHTAESPARQSADRCTRACEALASMQRAADRLCELTGEDDGRCKNVRARVDSARDVVRASCPDCEA